MILLPVPSDDYDVVYLLEPRNGLVDGKDHGLLVALGNDILEIRYRGQGTYPGV